MRKSLHFGALLLMLGTCSHRLLAVTEVPCAIPQRVYAQIVSRATSDPASEEAALTILQLIAEGRGETVTERAEAAVGLPPIFFESAIYKELSCRADAYLAIGRLASDSAIRYLESLSEGNFRTPHELHELWPAARVALHIAKLSKQADRKGRVAFLEASLRQNRDGSAGSYVAGWAITELCESGELGSFSLVARTIREKWSGLDAEEEVRFCRAQMDLVASNPDRTAALASALRARGLFTDHRLINWALRRLIEMKTERSEEILETFALEVYAMPEGSPRRKELLSHAASAWMRKGQRPPPSNGQRQE